MAALLMVAACGSSGGSDGAGGDGDGDFEKPDPDTLAWSDIEGVSADMNRYFEAVCRRNARCGDDSFADCNSWSNGVYCEPAFASAALPELDACIEALGSDPCDQHYAPECFGARKALRDTRGYYTLVREGEACDNRLFHCDFDLFCTAEGPACGMCEKLLGEGDACDRTEQCASAFYCDTEECAPLLEKGEGCDPYVDICNPGLFCNGEQCVELPARKVHGKPCAEDGECYSGFCQDEKCAEPSTCGAGELDAPCNNDAGCAEGLVCNVYIDHRCVPALADGAPCRVPASLCKPTSYCKGKDGTAVCAPQLAEGEPCETASSDDNSCASYYCGADQKCAPIVSTCE